MAKHHASFELSFCDHIRWQHLVAGVTGGVLSTLIVHPLDLIKIRFQGLSCQFISYIHICVKMLLTIMYVIRGTLCFYSVT